jgi:glycine C-acetyltransferase
MEGDMAPLPKLIELARRYNAILFVDDSHGLGVIGKTGRGTAEELGVFGQVEVLSGTLGKAIGGAAGGFISGKKEMIEYLRQKSRPYTFSNSLPPAVIMATLEAIKMLEEDTSLIDKLRENTLYFRREIKNLGFKIIEGIHPIVPIMLGEASLAMDMSEELLKEGVYIKGLWYPVVPKGEARLRAQISAALSKDDINRALEAFKKVGKKFGVI